MLRIQTTSGPVLGFADTYPLRDRSAASEIEQGREGGNEPVWKWLVSLAQGLVLVGQDWESGMGCKAGRVGGGRSYGRRGGGRLGRGDGG